MMKSFLSHLPEITSARVLESCLLNPQILKSIKLPELDDFERMMMIIRCCGFHLPHLFNITRWRFAKWDAISSVQSEPFIVFIAGNVLILFMTFSLLRKRPVESRFYLRHRVNSPVLCDIFIFK